MDAGRDIGSAREMRPYLKDYRDTSEKETFQPTPRTAQGRIILTGVGTRAYSPNTL